MACPISYGSHNKLIACVFYLSCYICQFLNCDITHVKEFNEKSTFQQNCCAIKLLLVFYQVKVKHCSTFDVRHFKKQNFIVADLVLLVLVCSDLQCRSRPLWSWRKHRTGISWRRIRRGLRTRSSLTSTLPRRW